ncbi:MAG: NUDIX domain-containing protein [Alphaproteobacteria bacterium]|nr:MAG: NUDIX domain-containing protein [Alphaproteobacteria bacterium]
MTLELDSAPGPAPEAEAGAREAPRRQVGALCLRRKKGRLKVLLITSRDTGRWIIPKGWPIEGLAPHQAAAREAWEEAGVVGRVGAAPLGSYRYGKRRKGGVIPCEVTVFPVAVEKLVKRYPERSQRRRRWMGLRKAAKRVDEPSLKALLAAVGEDALAAAEAGEPTRPLTGAE